MGDIDQQVRIKAFDFLKALRAVHGDNIPRVLLEKGFDFEGRRVPLVGPQGIFKPAVLPEIPLTLTTAPIVEGKARPYEDDLNEEGFLEYKYRGTDPNHHENVGLRMAMARGTPLIHLQGIDKGVYMATWPVYIVGDDPGKLTFTVAVDQPTQVYAAQEGEVPVVSSLARRHYYTVETQRRLHQQSFRYRVLKAYENRCAICRLRHKELLEAAHILPDGHPQGLPIVVNGISLCAIHHSAFDKKIIGIRPDYFVELRREVLEETDGPMLLHGLQEFHGKKLVLPSTKRDWPKPDYLEVRYQEFKAG